MAVNINWNQLQTPDFVGNALQYANAGQQQRQQQAKQSALAQYATNPEGAVQGLLAAGDVQTANALQQYASTRKLQDARTAAAPLATKGDYAGAAQVVAGFAPEEAQAYLKLDETQKAAAKAKVDKAGSIAFTLKGLPVEQRAAAAATMASELGIPPEAVPKLDLSDQGLDAFIGKAMSVKDHIDKLEKDRTFTAGRDDAATKRADLEADNKRQAARDAEAIRHNRVSERTSAMSASASMISAHASQKRAETGGARSAVAMAAQRYITENPDATADDIAKFGADFRKKQSAATAFGTGKQGQQVNSFNVGIAHLDTLAGLADALNNGDIPAINSIAQRVKTETGKAAPTNFKAAKQIVGDEIIKGIIGAGGGVSDREEAQKQISAANSPAQLKGVIGTYKELLAGQLNGLRLQYRNTTGLDDFEDHLLPQTRKELEGIGSEPPKASAKRPPLSSFQK